jgi:hypothetical protein
MQQLPFLGLVLLALCFDLAAGFLQHHRQPSSNR